MSDRPIIFSAPMVRALLAGRKTQTRRLAWKQDGSGDEVGTLWHDFYMDWSFRPIEGFFDYLAGRDGLIYSLKGGAEPRPLRGSPGSKGYLLVSLCGPEGIKTHLVHRLIATAWLGPMPRLGMEVRHLNSDRTCNKLENLDWGTAETNWSDRQALGHGIHEEHHAAKLTFDKAEAIRQSTLPQRRLAADYEVSQSTIWDIKQGRIWRKAAPAAGRLIALPEPARLWVKEAHYVESAGYLDGSGKRILYRADDPDAPATWTSPIYMPRWASRLTLTVNDVRVERVQDLSEEDAIAEGVASAPGGWWSGAEGHAAPTAKAAYAVLWNSLHGPDAWAANPWVAAVTFSVEQRNIDAERLEAVVA